LVTIPLVQAIMFGSYEMGKRIQRFHTTDQMKLYQSSIFIFITHILVGFAGGMTGIIFATCVTPIDLIKCRQQVIFQFSL